MKTCLVNVWGFCVFSFFLFFLNLWASSLLCRHLILTKDILVNNIIVILSDFRKLLQSFSNSHFQEVRGFPIHFSSADFLIQSMILAVIFCWIHKVGFWMC